MTPEAVTGSPVIDVSAAPISASPGKCTAGGSAGFGWNSSPDCTITVVASQCCNSSGNRNWSGLYIHFSRYWFSASPMTSTNDSATPAMRRLSNRTTTGVKTTTCPIQYAYWALPVPIRPPAYPRAIMSTPKAEIVSTAGACPKSKGSRRGRAGRGARPGSRGAGTFVRCPSLRPCTIGISAVTALSFSPAPAFTPPIT
jgi:hypothetical protein